MSWTLRLARENDFPALEELIPLFVRSLQAPYYSRAQIEAALGPVFGVDRRLFIDSTFFVAVHQEQLVACGGWSKRRSLFGSDQGRNPEDDSALDPEREPARIRAFFVHPAWARRGIGRALLADCETAIRDAGFHSAELVATLAGEPLYASCAYTVVERYEIPLDNGPGLPVVRMARRLTEAFRTCLARIFPSEPAAGYTASRLKDRVSGIGSGSRAGRRSRPTRANRRQYPSEQTPDGAGDSTDPCRATDNNDAHLSSSSSKTSVTRGFLGL